MNNWLDSFLGNKPLLCRIVGRIVRPDDIEDIVQETFLHSFAASNRQPIDNPRAFMARTARNLALNHITRAEQRLNQSIEELVGLEGEFEELTPTLESQHQGEEEFQSFCRAVAELPLVCRKVFILKKVYGLSQREIGRYLDIAESTVEKHVAKGLALVAAYMRNEGYRAAAVTAPAARRMEQ
jgi:RNA polymerase sigma factor (sigma-70 family)